MDLTPAHFSPAPAHSTPGTVDGLQPGNPGTQTVSVPWGSIVGNLSNQTDLTNALAAKANTADLNSHVSDQNNPHVVTKAQIGLGNVDDTSDMDKPVSIATAAAIAGVSIPAGQITDASALGRALLTNATADEDLDDLGAGANGKLLFAGATAATNRTNLGATAIGSNILTAADAPAVRDLIGLPLMPFGQCRVSKVGSDLVLQRFNGKYLFINGAFREIPAAGVSLAATGLTVNTVYNIYAFWTGSAIQLEASTTARATDATWGHQIKSGDATRSLVAKAFCGTGPAWLFDLNQAGTSNSGLAGVINWYNRRRMTVFGGSIPNVAISSQVTNFEPNQNSRAYFLSWGEDEATCHVAVTGNTSTGSVVVFCTALMVSSAGAGNQYTDYAQGFSNGAWLGLKNTSSSMIPESSGVAIPNSFAYGSLACWNNSPNTFTTVGGLSSKVSFMG